MLAIELTLLGEKMKKIAQCLMLTALVGIFFTACHEGPAERKGKKLDNAVENIQDKLQNKGPAQKAGEKIDELTDEDA